MFNGFPLKCNDVLLLQCLVVYLYHISSFIKNSVSGAGERALGSEVDRLLGNHPPLVPSGAASALAHRAERQQPAEAERQREGDRERQRESLLHLMTLNICRKCNARNTNVDLVVPLEES
ncbi:hypothetical protein EYF80_001517 [Liparis tanakae]|uniref:Uncharacterized protein n=1 Tax=Liparis tanakae TaxID=230148 RepID=A0A4Z2JE64_9TELE|nr:hypothetical protein EYF80_001517 [Liparis tanakae]